MRAYLHCILLLHVWVAAAGPLSLRDAQQQLLQNNHTVRSAEIELKKAGAEVNEAAAAYFPSLDAKASLLWNTRKNKIAISLPDDIPMFGGTSIEQEVGLQDRTELGVDLTYPIFTGFARKHALAAERENVACKEAVLEGTKNRLLLQLGVLYLQWSLSYRETDLREMLLRQLTARCSQLEQQFAAGTVIRSRLLEAQAKKRMAEVDIAGSRQKTDSLRYELVTFVGADNDSVIPDTSANPLEFTVPPMQAGIDTLRPELEALSKSRTRIELMRKVVKSGRLPVLAGMAGVRYGRPGLGMGTDSFMGYGQFGLNLSWNLFDGKKRRAREEQLGCTLDKIVIEREKSFEEFTKAYKLALIQMERAAQRLVAAREASKAARALAADLETCVQAGTVTQTEYLNALVAATQAQLLEQRIEVAGKIALLRARFAAGVSLVING
jgi:outer membrane protein TolC